MTAPASGQDKSAPTPELGESYARPIDRRFSFVEETLHGAPAGHFEYEQWVTWQTDTDEDSSFHRLVFKHELEYGISENVHCALELADWKWQHDREDSSDTEYEATGGELKLRFLDSRTDIFGLGFKTEVAVGRKKLKWENRLIVDKIVDRWQLAYNFIIGAGWEGKRYFHYEENGGELIQTAGVSYEVSPTVYVGAELIHEIPLPDWDSGPDQNLYVGPNLAYHGQQWAVVATAVFLTTGGDDEPQFQLRLIFEVDF